MEPAGKGAMQCKRPGRELGLLFRTQELVPLERGRDVIEAIARIRTLRAQHLPDAPQTDLLVCGAVQRDDILDGNADVRFPGDGEQNPAGTDILRQAGLRDPFRAIARDGNGQLQIEPSSTSLLHSK